MGLFGISEILVNLEQGTEREIFKTKVKGLLPTLADWMQSKWALLRGTVIGFWLGILPGGGAVLSSFVANAVEKRVSRHPEKIGTGIIEGVAAPEAANNSAAQAAFIPLLTLGLPANVVMALLLGALILHGVTPGPLLMTQNPDIFWGVIASMYLGNIMLLVLNLPLIGLWVQLLRIPYPYLMPLIIIFCILGAYSVANSLADVFFMFLFGLVGYIMKKLKFDSPPLVLAFVLGPLVEYYFKSALMFSRGSFTVFFTRPISLVCLAITAAILAWSILSGLRRKSKIIPRES
jgi:putative tricarboxylic transport membrane protein